MIAASRIIACFLALPAMLNFCGSEETYVGEPVARVGDNVLYSQLVEKVIPREASTEDSLKIAENFIKNWMREQVVIEQAKFNLPEAELDFEVQLDNYRNSLLIYKYESRLIQQKLDTFITAIDIEDYYKTNADNFILNEPAVRLFYMRLDSASHDQTKVLKQLTSGSPEGLEELKVYCQNYALEYFLDDTEWIKYNTLYQKLPGGSINEEMLSRINRPIVLNDKGISYYLLISDYTAAGQVAPLNLVSEEIRVRLLNQRKLELINKMRNDLFNEALNNKTAEIITK